MISNRIYIRTAIAERLAKFLQVVIENECYLFSMLHAGCEHFEKQRVTVRRTGHAHPLYHIVLYTKGEGTFSLHGREYPCSPGTLVVASPGERHEFPPATSSTASYLELTFEFDAHGRKLLLPMHELLTEYCGESLPPIAYPIHLEEAPRKRLEGMISWLLDRLCYDGEERFSTDVLVAEIFAFLCDEVYAANDERMVVVSSDLLYAKSEIERRFREHIDVRELADAVQRSTGHFSRAFKAMFGLSPTAYQMALRIGAAKNLLLTTSLACKEIAARVGFSDQYYFSKAFKAATGVAPAVFRGQRRSHDV